MQIVDVAQSTAAATGLNAALVFRNQTGAYGYEQAILLTDIGGMFPVRSTGTLIKTDGEATVAGGVDLSGVTLSAFALKSSGWQVNGSNATHDRREVIAGLSENAAVTDGGNKESVLLATSIAGSVGDGGGIEFGFGHGSYQSGGHPAYFGSIRGWGQNASGNTFGDIVVLTRAQSAATGLTEVFRFLGGGGVKLNGAVRISSGISAPNTTVTGTAGDLFINPSGTPGGIFWVKTTGTGNTGWTALA